jgi:hypothetical protein
VEDKDSRPAQSKYAYAKKIGKCVYCLKDSVELTSDHMSPKYSRVPYHNAGGNHLVPSCR